MQVSRLSLLVGLSLLFLLPASPFLLLLLLFSPFSVQEYSHYLSSSLYPCCMFAAVYLFCFCFPSPVLNLPLLTTFFQYMCI